MIRKNTVVKLLKPSSMVTIDWQRVELTMFLADTFLVMPVVFLRTMSIFCWIYASNSFKIYEADDMIQQNKDKFDNTDHQSQEPISLNQTIRSQQWLLELW